MVYASVVSERCLECGDNQNCWFCSTCIPNMVAVADRIDDNARTWRLLMWNYSCLACWILMYALKCFWPVSAVNVSVLWLSFLSLFFFCFVLFNTSFLPLASFFFFSTNLLLLPSSVIALFCLTCSSHNLLTSTTTFLSSSHSIPSMLILLLA